MMPGPVSGQGLSAIGDGRELWIHTPHKDGTGFSIFHWRSSDQPEFRLAPVVPLQGKLMAGGMATGNGFLWIVFSDGAVQTIRAVDDPSGTRLFDHLLMPSVPKVAGIRSMAVTRGGPWALVRVEDPAVLKQIDTPPPVEATPARRKGVADPEIYSDCDGPAATSAGTETIAPAAPPAKTKDAAESDASTSVTVPAHAVPRTPPPVRPAKMAAVDRLLRLERTRWVPLPLPADWPGDGAAWLVALSPEDDRPCLIAVAAGERVLRWYEWNPAPPPSATAAPLAKPVGPVEKPEPDAKLKDQPRTTTPTTTTPTPTESVASPTPPAPAGQWIRRDVALQDSIALPPQTLDRQLLLVKRLSASPQVELEVAYPREQRLEAIGKLSTDGPVEAWTLARAGDRLALITQDATGNLTWRRMGLSGAADPQPTPLSIRTPSITHMVDYIVFVAGLALATPFLILMWKKDPQGQSVQLPRGLKTAEIGSRGAAAIIDLTPGLLFVLFFRGVPVEQLMTLWPRHGISWESVSPQLTVIGIYVGYTFLAELFFGTSPGKAMLGLRVTGMHGEPPHLWQVLARNLIKAVELVATPLLIFAMVSPTRQRVGDMVARTVVVRRALPEDDEPRAGLFDDDDRDDPPPDPRPPRRDRK